MDLKSLHDLATEVLTAFLGALLALAVALLALGLWNKRSLESRPRR